ncbi:MAG: hypothetical protein K2X99_08355 [Gemmatimonadaceae bacterium]|nr:hypothetical protein [Gemmatimonadaceae bacterium]
MSRVPDARGVSRAQWWGAAALIGAFSLGAALSWWMLRERTGGVEFRVTATDAMPAELERLGLSPSQRDSVQGALRRGRDRVLQVADRLAPAMEAAIDSTDQELRQLLTPEQRVRFDAERAVRPAMRRTIKKDS